MGYELAKNFQTSLVATAPSPATSGTSLVVTAGQGARFDTPPFNAIVAPADAEPTSANAEIVRVTAISTDTLTITRAQESSSARTIVVGDRVFVGPTAKTFTDIAGTDTALFAAVAGGVDKTILNAKGDLFVASANDTPARLAVGTNEQALVADSAQTVGAKWATPLAGQLGYVPLANVMSADRAAASAALTRATPNIAGGGWNSSGTASPFLLLIPVFAGDLSVTGRSTKLKTQIVVGTNGTAPAVNFTVGISVVASAGGANVINHTWSTEVSGSTATITTPAANATAVATSSDFDIPTDGVYVLVCTTSGALAATNPRVNIGMMLYYRHV